MSWEPRYAERSLRVTQPELVAAWEAKLRALGFDDPTKLHPFAFRDLAEDLVKDRTLVAYQMGLGKTAMAIASILARGTKHALVVLPNKLMAEWTRELARLGVPAADWQIIERRADLSRYTCPAGHGEIPRFRRVEDTEGRLVDVERRCEQCDAVGTHVDALRRINLISFRTLWTIPKDSPHVGTPKRPAVLDQWKRTVKPERTGLKHSFAWELRRRCEYVIVDEAYALANPDSLQTRAVFMLKPRKRMLLTGTPVRGFPDNVIALLNWCLGGGSDLFPDFDATVEASRNRFLALFGTYVNKVRPDGSPSPRIVPKIRNPERFQAMMAPAMRRRVNLEPEVASVLKMPSFVIEPEQVPIDENIATLYAGFAADFATWYAEASEEAARDASVVPHLTLLSKMNFLSRLSACPQAIVPSYAGPSSKQQRILSLIADAHARGRKVILFTEHVESAEWYAAHAKFAALNPVLVTGSVSLARGKKSGTSDRERRLSRFRDGDAELIVATTACVAEGLNLPEASVVIFDSFPWVPSVQQQAWSRVLRPAQRYNPVEIRLVGAAGTIDDYIAAVCEIKRIAIGEGIDHETVEIDADELPDPHLYARALVEESGIVGAAYGASAWLARLKRQAA